MKPPKNRQNCASFYFTCSAAMGVIHHLSLAVLVVLTSCSRSSRESPATQSRTDTNEAARTESQMPLRDHTAEEIVAASSRSKTAFRVMEREITLNKQKPTDLFIGARLVDITSDGTTTIEVLDTTNRLRAGVGAFFTSAEYGQSGLKVLSASSQRQEVRLLRTWCD